MNLKRARSALSRSKGAASTFACASLSSIIRSRAFFRFSSRSLIGHLCLFIVPTTRISVEDRRKLAVAEDDRGLVIVVAHLWIAVDEKATTPSFLTANRSAVRTAPGADLQ